jgi:hypothetical protein
MTRCVARGEAICAGSHSGAERRLADPEPSHAFKKHFSSGLLQRHEEEPEKNVAPGTRGVHKLSPVPNLGDFAGKTE